MYHGSQIPSTFLFLGRHLASLLRSGSFAGQAGVSRPFSGRRPALALRSAPGEAGSVVCPLQFFLQSTAYSPQPSSGHLQGSSVQEFQGRVLEVPPSEATPASTEGIG